MKGRDAMYILHHMPDTAALIVRLALEGLSQPYRLEPVVKDANGNVSRAYLRLNPNGLIPVLETPHGPIFETAAIILWLADTHGQMAPAPSDPARAPFLTWLFFTSNTLHTELITLFYPHRYLPRTATKAHRDLLVPRLTRHFRRLDDLCQTAPAWLGAAQPSVLDGYIATLMRWAQLYPDASDRWFQPADYPALLRLAERLEARPATQTIAADEALGAQPFSAPPRPAA